MESLKNLRECTSPSRACQEYACTMCFVRVSVYIHAYIHTHIYICIYMHTYMVISKNLREKSHTYTYICTHMHTCSYPAPWGHFPISRTWSLTTQKSKDVAMWNACDSCRAQNQETRLKLSFN